MRALVFLLLTCLPPSTAFAMSCALSVQAGQWFPKKDLSPELLSALTTRRISVTAVDGVTTGILLAGALSDTQIELRLLTPEGKILNREYPRTRRLYPRVSVDGEVPEIVALADAKYGERRLRLPRHHGLIAMLRDLIPPTREVRMIYVEDDNRTFREFKGVLDLPDPREELASSLTGQRPCLRIQTPDGTHRVDQRRIVRIYR